MTLPSVKVETIGHGFDDYGEATTTLRTTSRELVAFVSQHNGAWLISMSGPLFDDATPDKTITCASSLAKAKRIARTMAAAAGYRGAMRWLFDHRSWELEASHVDEVEQYDRYA